VARVRVEVRRHLPVVREHLRHVLRPREVGVLVHGARRLQLGAFGRARPHAAEDGVGLEDDGPAAALEQVLAHGQAAHASANDDHPLRVHGNGRLSLMLVRGRRVGRWKNRRKVDVVGAEGLMNEVWYIFCR
jgi:hypothetical protein